MFAALIASVLVAKVIVSLVAGLPTGVFTRAGSWVNHRFLRRRERELKQALAGISSSFYEDESFMPRGIGLAVDYNARLIFIATRETGRLQAAILPFVALQGQSSGGIRSMGFYDYYVDIKVNSGPRPFWRLVCGDNPELAAELKQTLRAIEFA